MIGAYRIFIFSVSIRDVGKESTLQGIEV
jgi:hypothetical protein